MAISSCDKFDKEMCDVFGLKHVRELTINFKAGEIATVTAEFYPTVDNIRQVVPILRRFNLIPNENEDSTIEVNERGNKHTSFATI